MAGDDVPADWRYINRNHHTAHAPNAVIGRRPDGRSVGEVLRDADHLARDLLLDLTAADAAALLRAWPQLVASASGVWESLNTHAATAQEHPMRRLLVTRDWAADRLTRSRWPRPGPGHPSLEAIAGSFDRVANLIDRLGGDPPSTSTAARADVAAARMRLLHTLYLSTHAVTSALQQHGRDLSSGAVPGIRPPRLSPTGLPYAVGPAARWVERLTSAERVLGQHVAKRSDGFAGAVQGEASAPTDDTNRLPRAIAIWDVISQRVLINNPNPPDLLLACRTQGLVAGAALVILEAADRLGHLSPGEYADYLEPAITASGEAWSRLAGRWTDLAIPGARLDPSLANCAAELRASFREITHDGPTKATPDQIAARVDLPLAATALGKAIESAVDLAHLTRDAAGNPDLAGPARAMANRAREEVKRHTSEWEEPDTVWVTPRDLMRNDLVPLPRPVADALRSDAAAVTRAAALASAAQVGQRQEYVEGDSRSAVRDPGARARRTPNPPALGVAPVSR